MSELNNNITRGLAELDFLSGSLESMEQFAELYEQTLEQVKAIEDKQQRQSKAEALKALLLKQAEYLLNQWLAEKQKAGSLQLNPASMN